MSNRAVLLVNLGSPDSPSEADVRRYLREFLGDERVIDLPAPLRWLLLEGVILRSRPKKSAHAYASIWTENGSPLIHTSALVRAQLAAELGDHMPVYLAMRYGEPSIARVVGKMAADGVEEVFLIPQYPHYAMSSWETVVVRVREEILRQGLGLKLDCINPFYSDADYIDALAAVTKPFLGHEHDHVLFSYHGVPVRHLRKYGCTRGRAPRAADCCPPGTEARDRCYRAQVYGTTEALASRMGLQPGQYSVAFQSRLAGEPWCAPFTDHELTRLATEGKKRLLVLCPSFVADCLETLEEIAVAGRATFLAAGGESYEVVPCLNAQTPYIGFLAGRVERWRARAPAATGLALAI